jgi:chorismate mutase
MKRGKAQVPKKAGSENTSLQRDLKRLRTEIDRTDRELLKVIKARMRTVERIGRLKVKHGVPLLQKGRYTELLEKRRQMSARVGLDAAFTDSLFELIHDEALRIQTALASNGREKRKSR